jgi:hypothetical protein
MSNQQNDQLVEMIREYVPCGCTDCVNRRLIAAEEKIAGYEEAAETRLTEHRSEKYRLQAKITGLEGTNQNLHAMISDNVIRIANQDRLLKERETQFVTIEADYFKRYPARNQKLVDEVAELHRRIAGFNSRDEEFQVVIRDNKKYIKILETNLEKTRDELESAEVRARADAAQHQEETARVNDKLEQRIEQLSNIPDLITAKNLISRIDDLMKLNEKNRRIIKSASITSQETISKLQSEIALLKSTARGQLPTFPNVDELFDQFFQMKSCKESETKANEAMRRSGKTRG